jgi:hypothetical protein
MGKMNGQSGKREEEIHLQREEKKFEEELNRQVGVMSECLYQTMKEFIKLQNVIYCHSEKEKKTGIKKE